MRMNPLVYTGSKIVQDIEEECRAPMLYDSTDLSRLMIHIHQTKKKAGKGSTLGKGKGQGKLGRIFQGRIELKLEINQGL